MRPVFCVLLALVSCGCSSNDAGEVAGAAEVSRAADSHAVSGRVETSRKPDRPKIVILGDSLTAGYGLEPPQAFTSLLQRRLDEMGYAFDVVNAGVSGDTSAGGLRRLDWTIADQDVRVLVVELGANDGLRGLAVDEMKKNLSEIIVRAKERGVDVLLTGMEAPPNFGPHYTASFRQAYRDLAREHDVPLLPFLLEGVAGIPELNIPDGIHPNPEGARIVEANLWVALEPLLERESR